MALHEPNENLKSLYLDLNTDALTYILQNT